MLLLAALLAPTAYAQNAIQFTADVTQADGAATPTLTWITTPPATSCTASGNWSGAKAPSGSETVGPFTSSATFNLECSWPGVTQARMTWTNPTENTDGSDYTDAQSVRVVHARPGVDIRAFDCARPPPAGIVAVDRPPATTTHTFTGLSETGEYHFVVYAVNLRNVCSGPSNVAAKTITSAVAVTESVGVVVNPLPAAPSGLTVE